MRQSISAAAVLASVALVLGACGSAESTGTPSSGTTSMPPCTTELITAVAEASWSDNPDQANEVLGVTCAGDWALAIINFVDTNSADVAANGGEVPVTEGTLLFHFDGQAWGSNAGNDVCGTADMSTDPPAYPDDAQVPEAIWREACWTS